MELLLLTDEVDIGDVAPDQETSGEPGPDGVDERNPVTTGEGRWFCKDLEDARVE